MTNGLLERPILAEALATDLIPTTGGPGGSDFPPRGFGGDDGNHEGDGNQEPARQSLQIFSVLSRLLTRPLIYWSEVEQPESMSNHFKK